MFAGPPLASPSFAPVCAQSRTRQRVPPPSTPSRSVFACTVSAPFGSSCNTLTRENESGSDTLCLDLADSRARILAMDTERPSPRYSGIDIWDPADVLDAMIEGQFAAVAAGPAARPAPGQASPPPPPPL